MNKITKIPKGELCGYFGMVLLNGAPLPTLAAMMLGKIDPPPALLLIVMIAGLIMYQIRAWSIKDKLYLISNSVGLVTNSFLLFVVLFS